MHEHRETLHALQRQRLLATPADRFDSLQVLHDLVEYLKTPDKIDYTASVVNWSKITQRDATAAAALRAAALAAGAETAAATATEDSDSDSDFDPDALVLSSDGDSGSEEESDTSDSEEYLDFVASKSRAAAAAAATAAAGGTAATAGEVVLDASLPTSLPADLFEGQQDSELLMLHSAAAGGAPGPSPSPSATAATATAATASSADTHPATAAATATEMLSATAQVRDACGPEGRKLEQMGRSELLGLLRQLPSGYWQAHCATATDGWIRGALHDHLFPDKVIRRCADCLALLDATDATCTCWKCPECGGVHTGLTSNCQAQACGAGWRCAGCERLHRGDGVCACGHWRCVCRRLNPSSTHCARCGAPCPAAPCPAAPPTTQQRDQQPTRSRPKTGNGNSPRKKRRGRARRSGTDDAQ